MISMKSIQFCNNHQNSARKAGHWNLRRMLIVFPRLLISFWHVLGPCLPIGTGGSSAGFGASDHGSQAYVLGMLGMHFWMFAGMRVWVGSSACMLKNSYWSHIIGGFFWPRGWGEFCAALAAPDSGFRRLSAGHGAADNYRYNSPLLGGDPHQKLGRSRCGAGMGSRRFRLLRQSYFLRQGADVDLLKGT